ncbi:Uncharacterised protein [Vibrio cholerae]|nr:Uncharacterised protein [Vibrio cholerae]
MPFSKWVCHVMMRWCVSTTNSIPIKIGCRKVLAWVSPLSNRKELKMSRLSPSPWQIRVIASISSN